MIFFFNCCCQETPLRISNVSKDFYVFSLDAVAFNRASYIFKTLEPPQNISDYLIQEATTSNTFIQIHSSVTAFERFRWPDRGSGLSRGHGG